jgi:circadian clock protein KaiC
VLDPVSALMKTGGQVSAVHAAFRLLDYAKCRGITVVCTSLITTNEMPEVATTMDISTIADTWIHLSYKVLGGERNRTLSIVKSRGMGHSNQVRELVLDDSGPSLRDVYTAGGEVLVGTARYEKEAENELRRRRRQLEADLKRSQLEAMESSITVRIEALQQELAAKRREIDFFEAESGAVSRADEENEVSVRRLRSADVTGMGA